MMVDSFSELSGSHHHHPSDPDAQQTLTDFIDYTEFFPSDLSRSLTLIGKLDERFKEDAQTVHRLTKTYGALPTLPSEERPDPKTLRKDISSTLEHAIRAREASLAEASRLCNVVDALYDKLVGIKAKLQAMPTPPSREPTPPKSSPIQNRNKKDKSQNIKLSGSASNTGKDAAGVVNGLPKIQKNRQRRIVVPGEPLPPYDPASPGADISSESESERAMSPMDTIRVEPFGDSRADRSHKKYRDKMQRLPRAYSTSGPFPKMRPRGVFGTNVHSQVAGISVSNAMASLTPPPENPPPGSEWAPWLELTDWELNILRRRMKKNANWTPSDTMKRRTLSEKGRGQAAYLQAKEEAEAKGVELLNEMPHRSGRKAEAMTPGGMEMIMLSDLQEETINRGMKLNEQKKLKQARDLMVAAAAASASGTDQSPPGPQALDSTDLERIIADAGRNVAQAFQAMQHSSPPYSHKSPTGKKRKAMMEEQPPVSATDIDELEQSPPPTSKKQKLRNGGIAVPLAPEGPTMTLPKRGRPRKIDASVANTPVNAGSEAATAAPSPRSSTMHPPTTAKRPSSSRGASVVLTMNTTKAASAEPPSRKLNLRRSSNVSLPAQNESAAVTTGRRGRKPAPGFPKTGVEDANTVSSTKRKAKPGKPVEKNIPFDEIDPLEPRYCICGDVSWGDMVACENDNCQGGEWFHFECVGLEEQPPRRQKWYCPVCRDQLGVNVTGATMQATKGGTRGR